MLPTGPIPQQLEGASGALTLGVRPEHVHLSDAASYRGEVIAAEYLGTTQIVTLKTPNGNVKARIAAHVPIRVGERTGLELDARTLSVFNASTGAALTSVANKEVLAHG